MTLRRRGAEARLVLEGHSPARKPDDGLVEAVAKAHVMLGMLTDGLGRTIADVANAVGVHIADASRILPLAFLAPKITDAILRGRQPVELAARALMRDDLYRGNRSPILQPGIGSWEDTAKRYSGPAKRPTKIFAAACSEALHHMGQSQAEADQLVSSKMAKWPAFDRCDNTPRTLKSWRDKFRKDDAFQFLVNAFTRDIEGQQHLQQVLLSGPPHVRGFQKRRPT